MKLRRNPITHHVEYFEDRPAVVSEVVVDEAPGGPATLVWREALDPTRPIQLSSTMVAPRNMKERIAAILAQIEDENASRLEEALVFIETHGFQAHREVTSHGNPFDHRSVRYKIEALG